MGTIISYHHINYIYKFPNIFRLNVFLFRTKNNNNFDNFDVENDSILLSLDNDKSNGFEIIITSSNSVYIWNPIIIKGIGLTGIIFGIPFYFIISIIHLIIIIIIPLLLSSSLNKQCYKENSDKFICKIQAKIFFEIIFLIQYYILIKILKYIYYVFTHKPPLKLWDTKENIIINGNKWMYYTCISHRWNSHKDIVKLKGMEWDAIGINSNDLEKLRKKLYNSGNRFIWIDNLCINQDNLEEKSKEIKNMGDYYKNAYRTIVLLNGIGNKSNIINTNNELTEWFNRVWIMQEVILSPNVIFYIDDENEETKIMDIKCIMTKLTYMAEDINLSTKLRYDIICALQLLSQNGNINKNIISALGLSMKRQCTYSEDYIYGILGFMNSKKINDYIINPNCGFDNALENLLNILSLEEKIRLLLISINNFIPHINDNITVLENIIHGNNLIFGKNHIFTKTFLHIKQAKIAKLNLINNSKIFLVNKGGKVNENFIRTMLENAWATRSKSRNASPYLSVLRCFCKDCKKLFKGRQAHIARLCSSGNNRPISTRIFQDVKHLENISGEHSDLIVIAMLGGKINNLISCIICTGEIDSLNKIGIAHVDLKSLNWEYRDVKIKIVN